VENDASLLCIMGYTKEMFGLAIVGTCLFALLGIPTMYYAFDQEDNPCQDDGVQLSSVLKGMGIADACIVAMLWICTFLSYCCCQAAAEGPIFATAVVGCATYILLGFFSIIILVDCPSKEPHGSLFIMTIMHLVALSIALITACIICSI
jgi:hypothetical protein